MRMLLIGNPTSPYCSEISAAAEKHRIRCDIVPFDQLASHLKGNSETISTKHEELLLPLNEYDVCLVRNMPGGSLEQVVFRMDLLWSLESCGVTVINPPKAIECAVDKYLTLSRCRRAGLAVPETYCCESAEQALAVFDDMNRDVILKPLFGAEGRGIVRITDPETARRVFNAWEQIGAVLYLQKFLCSDKANQSDLRILMLDGKPLGAIKRTSSVDFRTNCSLDGAASLHYPSDAEINLAQQACLATGTIFAGVDLIYDQDGHLYLLEVNACPGWSAFRNATGIDVPEKVVQWVKSM